MPGEQVAFARAVTDGATYAWVCDVFVAPAARGVGVGSAMVGELVRWLEAQGIMRVVLATRDAHEVYARLGFEPLANPSTWMERDRRPQRLSPGAASG
jgi:GNAT superfamily N-acetyltransferase